MKQCCFLCCLLLATIPALARYQTPGTGVRWSLANLVANANGAVTVLSESDYQVNDTVFISANDTLFITADATVRFVPATYFSVSGVITVNPPIQVTFTAVNPLSGYLGMRLDNSSGSLLRKLTFEYAVSLRLLDCSPVIDSCIFRYNNNSTSTAFGNSAINLFRSNARISNSRFFDNQRAAISGGANIANAPQIYNCIFSGNNTQNTNVPQINLGTSGTDTTRIFNNQILRASTNTGGIGFLPIGNLFVVISGNTIKSNRYGLSFNGGANINALLSNNQLDSNNIQNDPYLGGSGVAFAGGSATSHQNVVLTGNLIRWNLWGITIGATSTGGGAKPNLGNLLNTDTTDDGRNQIYGNNNAITPNTDLYNNNVDSIYAQNNYWGSGDLSVVESRIFHQPDNAALGFVLYQPLYAPLPVRLLSLSATRQSTAVLLQWQTATESNSDHFAVERSTDGRNFYAVGKVNAARYRTQRQEYRFTDAGAAGRQQTIYYRLKQVDQDGRFSYSAVVKVVPMQTAIAVSVYPNPVKEVFTLSVVQPGNEPLDYTLSNATGQVLAQRSQAVTGTSAFTIDALATQPAGTYFLKVAIGHTYQQLKITKW